MTTQVNGPMRRRLRLWPGVLLAALVLLTRFVVPVVLPDATIIGVLVGMASGPLLLIWWLFFSRAPWAERLGIVAAIAVIAAIMRFLVDPSISTGAMGMLFFILAMPLITIAFVAAAVATRGWSDGTRRVAMVLAVVVACASLTLIRTNGFDGQFDHDFAWRWTPTAEDRLLASEAGRGPQPAAAPFEAPLPAAQPVSIPLPAGGPPAGGPTPDGGPVTVPLPPPAGAVTAESPTLGARPTAPGAAPVDVLAAGAPIATPVAAAEWPGFRGPQRDGIVRGSHIGTNWASAPPVAMWKRAVGPGWSSFAVRGDRFYTQEQRGEEEVVACYRVATGEPVWQHRDRVRFWESNAGAGPRATPLVHGSRVYALGAKGRVSALDAATGTLVWARDAAVDTGATLPMWGFSGSPVVVGDIVAVAASGALVAYDLATGAPRWTAKADAEGYSSPQLLTLGGVPHLVLVNSQGITSVSPADGKTLWTHAWKGHPMVQPTAVGTDGVLMAVNDSEGLRRLAVARGGAGAWTATEKWTSRGLKPYFNDFVVHEGHAYGFDGAILSCIELANGERKWKGGRYGNGQLVLLADQDAMLVLSEEGEIALVRATPDGYAELGKIPGIEGKTWNHPVVVGDVLLARNGEQMAAFRLPAAAR